MQMKSVSTEMLEDVQVDDNKAENATPAIIEGVTETTCNSEDMSNKLNTDNLDDNIGKLLKT